MDKQTDVVKNNIQGNNSIQINSLLVHSVNIIIHLQQNEICSIYESMLQKHTRC